MATNIEVVATDSKPAWDAADLKGSLERLRDHAEREAIKASDWYFQRKRWKAMWSRGLRMVAIVSTALAGLFPIAAKTVPGLPPVAQNALIPAFLFGLTAAMLGADRAFGFSSGWIRYITAGTAIRRAIEEFRMDWTLHLARLGEPASGGGALELVQLAKDFRLAIENLVLEETRAWTAEFQSSLAQLEKETHARIDSKR